MLCTIYNDGSHYIAIPKNSAKRELKKIKRLDNSTAMDKAFDEFYLIALKEGLSLEEQKSFILKRLAERFGRVGDILDNFIEQKFAVKLKNIALRKKRFQRKAFLNKWNYFVTFTYNDKLQTEESFRTKLRKSLSNFATRRGWRFMGVWEYGAEEQRLHFHALMYIPEGQMVGCIREVKEYSKRLHKVKIRHENSFFLKFGINDFAYIGKDMISKGKTLDYILKYISKTDDKIVYSRGIPSNFIEDIVEEDVVAEMEDFVVKYILFDDIFYSEHRRVSKSFSLDEFCEDVEEVVWK